MNTTVGNRTTFGDLYEAERLARKEGKVEELKRIFLEMIGLCSDEKEVVSLIRVMAARRGQDRNAIKWLVNEVYSRNKEEEFVLSLLKEVVEGKMYLEEERIIITNDLKERKNNPLEALKVILDVPVETFTMIPESTIVKYQLEQFRLCVEVQDWVKADITMRKIRKKYFSENKAQEEEILFYKYIVEMYLGQDKYLEASTTYMRLNEIVDKKEFTILSSFFGILCTCLEKGRKGHLERLANDRNNEEGMRVILDRFLSPLIIEKEYVGVILPLVCKYRDVNPYLPNLLQAIDEHNFFIVESFYSTISISTCSRLLDVDPEDLINRISHLVNNGLSNSKINQKEGVIVFRGKDWNSDVGDVLNKLIRVEHMIHKEKLK